MNACDAKNKNNCEGEGSINIPGIEKVIQIGRMRLRKDAVEEHLGRAGRGCRRQSHGGGDEFFAERKFLKTNEEKKEGKTGPGFNRFDMINDFLRASQQFFRA